MEIFSLVAPRLAVSIRTQRMYLCAERQWFNPPLPIPNPYLFTFPSIRTTPFMLLGPGLARIPEIVGCFGG